MEIAFTGITLIKNSMAYSESLKTSLIYNPNAIIFPEAIKAAEPPLAITGNAATNYVQATNPIAAPLPTPFTNSLKVPPLL